jgi:CheY-like chemotaxis protein
MATSAQWMLERAALLTPMMASTSNLLGGIVLIAAGLYQWTPLKEACLFNCQTPLTFITRHGGFRGDPSGAVTLGLRHGLYCVGCCWALMVLLFVGGVMNLFWIAALGVLALLEKVMPYGQIIARLAGGLFVLALILMDIQLPIMDGYEATRQIKADPALRSVPIIAVTSYALSGEEKKARAAGCDDYVPKPFSPRQLLAKIRQYLS